MIESAGSQCTASSGSLVIAQVRIEGQPLNSVLGIKSRFAGNGGEECSVEELALQYYAAEAGGGWTGEYSCSIAQTMPLLHSAHSYGLVVRLQRMTSDCSQKPSFS